MGDNSDSHELLSVVAAVHHQGVGKTLNDWALCLSESLLCESTGRVGDVDGCSDLDVVAVLNCVSQSPASNPMPSKCPSISPSAGICPPKRRNRESYVNEISRISTSS